MCGRFASSFPPDEIRRDFVALGETAEPAAVLECGANKVYLDRPPA